MGESAMPRDSSPQREFALEVVRKLRAAGHQAIWAGGCVRDALLGRTPKDYDVATSALPDQVRQVFGKRRTLPIGAAFGVITVLGPKSAGQIEVATFRSDAEYADGRRPRGVAFTDAQHDASRRDFTINGLFFDPIDEQVIDYVGGREDLNGRVIRAIGDPGARFDEDKLRMLRAVRFAANLGFEIEPQTRSAIQQRAAEIKVVSGERIGAELSRMLQHDSRAEAVRMLAQVGLLRELLPEVAALAPDAFEERLAVLGRLHSPSLPLGLATLLPTNSKPPAGTRLAKRLKYTNEVAKQTDWLLENRDLAEAADRSPWPEVQRILIKQPAEDLVAWLEAEQGEETPASRFCKAKLALPPEELDPPPLIVGADLISVGLRPGPDFAKLLKLVRDKQLLGEVTSKQQAIAFVQDAARG